MRYCPNCGAPVEIDATDSATCCGITWNRCASLYLSYRSFTKEEFAARFKEAKARAGLS
jgi:hypothetical protein